MAPKYFSVQLILVGGRAPLEVMIWAKAKSEEVENTTGYVTGIALNFTLIIGDLVVLEQRTAALRAVL